MCVYMFLGRSLLELGGNNAIIGKTVPCFLFSIQNIFDSCSEYIALVGTRLVCFCLCLRPDSHIQEFYLGDRTHSLKAEITRKEGVHVPKT